MSEIDVSECEYNDNGECNDNGIMKPCLHRDCYFKELQQLKEENEELKKLLNQEKVITIDYIELEQKLEKIRNLCDNPETFIKYFEDSEGLAEDIVQIIESEKE